MPAITVRNIKKYFGKTRAVDNVSFDVEQGEIFGIIGPDGSGKTTLLRIIISLIKQDSGKASVFGFDNITGWQQIRQITGYMPQQFSLYQDLSVEENLKFFADIFGVSVRDNYDLISDIYSQLEPFAKRKAGKLSGGMKQKLALSCALIHRPRLLVLDEPNTGVDAISRQQMWNIITRLKQQGITIILTTPYMNEAEGCDRVALMQNGHLLAVDTPNTITSSFNKKLFAVKVQDINKALGLLRQYQYCHFAFAFGQTIHYADTREKVNPTAIKNYLLQHDCHGVSVTPLAPSIEDCFIDLMDQTQKK